MSEEERGRTFRALPPGASRRVEDGREQREMLGRAIRVRRAELGLGRRALAERSGLSYPYVSELENGKKSGSYASLRAIADSLDLPLHELLERGEALGGYIDVDRISAQATEGDANHGLSPALAASPRASRREGARFGLARGPSHETSTSTTRGQAVDGVVEQLRLALGGVPPGIAEAALLEVLGSERVRGIVRDELRRERSQRDSD